MLRITVALNADEMWMRLEGRLIGPWVEELRRAWISTHSSAARQPVQVDLSGVTFVCAEGKELLARMAREGAVLHATDVVNQAMIAEMRPLRQAPAAEPRRP